MPILKRYEETNRKPVTTTVTAAADTEATLLLVGFALPIAKLASHESSCSTTPVGFFDAFLLQIQRKKKLSDLRDRSTGSNIIKPSYTFEQVLVKVLGIHLFQMYSPSLYITTTSTHYMRWGRNKAAEEEEEEQSLFFPHGPSSSSPCSCYSPSRKVANPASCDEAMPKSMDAKNHHFQQMALTCSLSSRKQLVSMRLSTREGK